MLNNLEYMKSPQAQLETWKLVRKIVVRSTISVVVILVLMAVFLV